MTRSLGTERRPVDWVLPDHDHLRLAVEILNDLQYVQSQGRDEEVEHLKDQLRSLPGYPTHDPDTEVVVLSVRKPIIVEVRS